MLRTLAGYILRNTHKSSKYSGRARNRQGLKCLLQKPWGTELGFPESKKKTGWCIPVTQALRNKVGVERAGSLKRIGNSLGQWMSFR